MEEILPVPEAWLGQDVVVFGIGQSPTYAKYGRLESVSELGLVLRHATYISWATNEYTYETDAYGNEATNSDTRVVPQFYPWHVVTHFRLQEEEEKRRHGLE